MLTKAKILHQGYQLGRQYSVSQCCTQQRPWYAARRCLQPKYMNKRLSADDDAVNSLYMDNGYLFFQLVPIEKDIDGDSISLEMRVMEGPQARINNVVINGNDRLYEKVVRRELRVKPGELFSKSDLMRSLREIAQTGHFNPENMAPDIQPNEENGTVDVILNLESKANDQIEFSMGWGQTGIIGKLSLKFTNFSIKTCCTPAHTRVSSHRARDRLSP